MEPIALGSASSDASGLFSALICWSKCILFSCIHNSFHVSDEPVRWQLLCIVRYKFPSDGHNGPRRTKQKWVSCKRPRLLFSNLTGLSKPHPAVQSTLMSVPQRLPQLWARVSLTGLGPDSTSTLSSFDT